MPAPVVGDGGCRGAVLYLVSTINAGCCGGSALWVGVNFWLYRALWSQSACPCFVVLCQLCCSSSALVAGTVEAFCRWSDVIRVNILKSLPVPPTLYARWFNVGDDLQLQALPHLHNTLRPCKLPAACCLLREWSSQNFPPSGLWEKAGYGRAGYRQ